MKIPFHIPFTSGAEEKNISRAIAAIGGSSLDESFVKECERKLEYVTKSPRVLVTGSCTHAIQLALMLLNLKPGDEVICPSFTYVSVANTIVLLGGTPVFIDCEKDTFNIDVSLLEKAISNSTKAIIIMHYAAVSCDMEGIRSTAKAKQIPIIEDAAHCIQAYRGTQHLGTIGDFGTLSFHHTKNVHCVKGGALLINNQSFIERAITIRDNGTNKKAFVDGKIDKYTWIDRGSNFGLNELAAAYLSAQLDELEQVTTKRISLWKTYFEACKTHSIPCAQNYVGHNGHIFYIFCHNAEERARLIKSLVTKGVDARFHYIPLHLSKIGSSCRYVTDNHSINRSETILRLPLYYGMSTEDIHYVVQQVSNFYN